MSISKRLLSKLETNALLALGLLFLLGLGLYMMTGLLLIWGIPILIWSYFESRAHSRKYYDYLKSLEGTGIFCYNNRTDSKVFIEENILPILSQDIKVVYLDGKVPKSDLSQTFISEALYKIKDKRGFPYLLKISNGQVIDQSINNDFYNTMNQNKDIGLLMKKINSFYDSD